MTISADDQAALGELDSRIRIVLPEEYQDSYEDVQPVSMGSAGLKYAGDGRVAWDDMWDTFCDLAMAGGPPHKGSLLQPGTPADIVVNPDRYREVVDEICRGVKLVADLPAEIAPDPGWIRVECYGDEMAGWLLRAIVMENVAARADGAWLDLPAAPGFRLEKEIKNVITVIAKTSHYWIGHMPLSQERAIARLFTAMEKDTPLVVPADHASGWLGVECPSVRAAIWMMRALVVSNVLSRREERVLFVPVNETSDPGGARVSSTLARIQRLARARGVL